MTKTRFAVQMTRTAAALLLLAGTAVAAGAQTKVYPYPGDQTWQPWTQVGGTAAVTGANPDQWGGNGSLELHTVGDLSDWGFYTHYADGGSYWGYLQDVNTLQFDWYREATSVSSSYGSPWLAQTPVLRLLLREDLGSQYAYSELVWEKYYTDPSPATLNAWQTVDMFAGNGQNFWYHSITPSDLYAEGSCTNMVSAAYLAENKLPVFGTTLGTWSGSPCNLGALEVYGVALGVGSYWPEAYAGYVDWLQLGFTTDQDGPAVYADFELPPTVVPEPGTILLVGTGLLGLGAASWRSRRRRGQE